MDKDKIQLSDIKRILIGEAPVEFLLEVFLRSIVAYVVMLVIIKLLGKRMSGKLTPTEMAVMLMFGAIVSGIMQIPDRGVIEGIFVLLLVLFIQRRVTLWTTKSETFETRVLGKMQVLVKDGVLETRQLKQEKISRSQLFAMLRSKNYSHLGEVKRLYMETSGSFSLFKAKEPPPGLSLYPEEDKSLFKEQSFDAGKTVCYDCGTLYQATKVPSQCGHCQGSHFTDPVNK
jgi:uncharacterized membrane protein YcaP (DUF421 family)